MTSPWGGLPDPTQRLTYSQAPRLPVPVLGASGVSLAGLWSLTLCPEVAMGQPGGQRAPLAKPWTEQLGLVTACLPPHLPGLGLLGPDLLLGLLGPDLLLGLSTGPPILSSLRNACSPPYIPSGGPESWQAPSSTLGPCGFWGGGPGLG